MQETLASQEVQTKKPNTGRASKWRIAAGILLGGAIGVAGGLYIDDITEASNNVTKNAFRAANDKEIEQLKNCRTFVLEHSDQDADRLKVPSTEVPDNVQKDCGIDSPLSIVEGRGREFVSYPEGFAFEVVGSIDITFPTVAELSDQIEAIETESQNLDRTVTPALGLGVMPIFLGAAFAFAGGAIGALQNERVKWRQMVAEQ